VRTVTKAMMVAMTMLVACGGDAEEEVDPTPSCDNPDYNPWLGTCVETFVADCFDPAGACDGVVDQSNGSTSFTWDNGAAVQTEISGMNNVTELISSSGSVCAVGETPLMPGGACFSTTTYTRSSDGAQMTFCIYEDQSMDVTCPDGSTHSATAEQQQGASECQYGSGSGEACSVELQ
jgi:hypothetical protein